MLGLKNWHPLTLLNADYKIISKCFALRMKRYLENLIHIDQKRFMQGRVIGCNIRKMLDIIDYVGRTGTEGVIFSLDFEKAFDRIEHCAVERAFLVCRNRLTLVMDGVKSISNVLRMHLKCT